MVKTIAFIPVILSCLIAEESLPLSCGELLLSNKNTFQYIYRGDTIDLTDLNDSICYIVEMSPISVIQYRVAIEVYNGWVSEPITHNDTSSIIEAKASTSISYGIDSDNELEEVTIECALTAYKPIYPRIVVQAGIEGIVYVKAVLRKSGGLSNIAIIKSAENQLLDRSALNIVEEAEFYPDTLNGFPQKVLLIIPLTFRIM